MISRVYLKDYLSFKKIEIEFGAGLNVITGVSGAGKSVFTEALLSAFGLKVPKEGLVEVDFSKKIELLEYGIESEDITIFKSIKKDRVRHFINSQALSKKIVSEISSKFIKYVSLKDSSEFDSNSLISLLDYMILDKDKSYKNLLERYLASYSLFLEKNSRLKEIIESQKNIEELKEFLKFEIDKIESISPKDGEYEELLGVKKQLSKKDKIEDALKHANAVFEHESSVLDLLELLDKDSSFFSDSLNELRVVFDEAQIKLEEFLEMDIEEMLDRIEKLSSLIKKYGSIDECLSELGSKKEELDRLENISFEKSALQKEVDSLKSALQKDAKEISLKREAALSDFNSSMNSYLKSLFLEGFCAKIEPKELDINGRDKIEVFLKNAEISSVSAGEFNRLRLSILLLRSKFIKEDGVIFLDEIDANLSGAESESIAKILKELSKNYQIFAISHQPHLPSLADSHYLISKKDDKSSIKILDSSLKEDEIARMVSGEEVTEEAKLFAKKLLAKN